MCRLVRPVPSVLTAKTGPWLCSFVPYRVLPDKTNPEQGKLPSLSPSKLCRFVKPDPSVLTAKTVPLPHRPPFFAVPYKVLPERINPDHELIPSLLVSPVSGSE